MYIRPQKMLCRQPPPAFAVTTASAEAHSWQWLSRSSGFQVVMYNTHTHTHVWPGSQPLAQTAHSRPPVACCFHTALQKLRKWMQDKDSDYILGAGSKGESDTQNTDGVFFCHAYALLEIVLVPVSRAAASYEQESFWHVTCWCQVQNSGCISNRNRDHWADSAKLHVLDMLVSFPWNSSIGADALRARNGSWVQH